MTTDVSCTHSGRCVHCPARSWDGTRPRCLQVQIAALEILPLIPPHKLRSLLSPDGRLSGTLTRQLATSSKEVRAAAFSAAGRWLSDASSTSVLAAIPDAATLPRKWVQSITGGLVDPGQAAAAAAFDAARCATATFRSIYLELSHSAALIVGVCMQTAAEQHRGGQTRGWRPSAPNSGYADHQQYA